jgi:hypothetical protein
MKKRQSGGSDLSPPVEKSMLAAVLRGGAVGALAGSAGGVATWLALFAWDSMESGRLEWASLENLRSAAVLSAVFLAVAIPCCTVLAVLQKR